MKVVDGTGQIVPEPDWKSLFNDELELFACGEHWRIITTELKDRALVSMANAHGLQRLVVCYVIYDRALKEIAENGAVSKPKRGNTRAIARVTPHFNVLRDMANDAATLEAEFGISPRRRSSATKSVTQKKASKPSDAYLKPVAKG